GYSCSDGDTCRFTLKSNKGLELNRFHIPTKAIAALGPYVVFVHENSYSAEEGIQYLSFLDLSNYGPSLGSAEIPVFRLPVLMDEPVSSLEVRPDGLKLNGKDTIPVETFVAASEMQQAAFNITANF